MSNKFTRVEYHFEDVTDETIDDVIKFKDGVSVVTDRALTDLETRLKYTRLYNLGYIDRRVNKYDVGRRIEMTWTLSPIGENLLNSERMIPYNRKRNLDTLLS